MRKLLQYAIAGLVVAVVVALLLFSAAYWRISHPTVSRAALPTGLVGAQTREGAACFAAARAKADHALLAPAFQAQEKQTWCGVASSVIALRALGIEPNLTQSTFFDARTWTVRASLQVTFGGMTLAELGRLLIAHGATVTVVHADETDLARFRATLARALGDPTDVMLVNYRRAELGQGDSGHISPVAAYDAESDRALVLDTAAYRWPPTWIPVAALFAAMSTVDPSAGRARGYAQVRRPRPR